MKICILHIGHSEPGAVSAHKPSPQRFQDALAPHLHDAKFTTISAVTDELPAHDDYDAFLITGGKYSVFEQADWQDRLLGFIRELHRHQKPLLAICYGHQAVAQALGGAVERSEKGYGVGIMPVTATTSTDWGPHAGQKFMLHAMHQDQVTHLPPGARLWLSSDFCPISGYTIGTHFWCIQQHPDFTCALNHDLVEKRRARIGDATSDQAIASLSGKDDTAASVQWMANFLCKAVERV